MARLPLPLPPRLLGLVLVPASPLLALLLVSPRPSPQRPLPSLPLRLFLCLFRSPRRDRSCFLTPDPFSPSKHTHTHLRTQASPLAPLLLLQLPPCPLAPRLLSPRPRPHLRPRLPLLRPTHTRTASIQTATPQVQVRGSAHDGTLVTRPLRLLLLPRPAVTHSTHQRPLPCPPPRARSSSSRRRWPRPRPRHSPWR